MARTPDETAMVHTITGATSSVDIAVMDFLPSSMSLWSNGAPTFRPALTNALLYVINARPVRARVLVSKWAWSDPTMAPYLRALLATSKACRQGQQAQCRGGLEVRQFIVPGWNQTLGVARAYPGHSRVNHNKVRWHRHLWALALLRCYALRCVALPHTSGPSQIADYPPLCSFCLSTAFVGDACVCMPYALYSTS